MTIHIKQAGAWTNTGRPYVKRAGVWTPVQEAYVKRSGTWQLCYAYDNVPPPVPSLDGLVTNPRFEQYGDPHFHFHRDNFIKVSVRGPLSGNDPNIKMIRVLWSRNGAPTTQYGGSYESTPDPNHPNEPWSDYYYNNAIPGAHADTSQVINKYFPIGVYREGQGSLTSGYRTYIEYGDYFFAAWALDFNGNWSLASSLHVRVDDYNFFRNQTVYREGRFQPISGGTWDPDGFAEGRLNNSSPQAMHGAYFYGNQIYDAFKNYSGHVDVDVEVQSAQIQLQRLSDDDGDPTANVYMFWHNYATASEVPSYAGFVKHDTMLIGTLSKGEQKWFNLPEAFIVALRNGGIKGFGFAAKDPAKAVYNSADYSVFPSVAENFRAGELYANWTEEYDN